MASAGEKLLAAEMLGALTVTWIAKVAQNAGSSSGTGWTASAPQPHQMLGQVFLYAGLAFVAMFGEQPARLAAGVGGLVLLVILIKGAGNVFGATLGAAGAPIAGPALKGQPKGVFVA